MRPYPPMMNLAQRLVSFLSTSCERIEIAGSLRRRSPLVSDIELVAIPTFYTAQAGLFEEGEKVSWLDEQLAEWMDSGYIVHAPRKCWGEKMKSFVVKSVKVDLFIQVDPATWGVNFMLRTGSANFSRQMVTPCSKGGFMPDRYHVANARVWEGKEALPTPEEEDVFRLWGIAWIQPELR